jgi:cytochrome P450 family 307 subfamily A
MGCAEVVKFLDELSRITKESKECKIKPLLQAACFNMFSQYMCTTRFEYDNAAFCKVVHTFDNIFWEMNQGYAIDFIPWLYPVYKGHMNRISTWSHEVRQFILSNIVEKHRQTMDYSAEPRDFTDALLMYLEEDKILSWEHIIFELEDFLGGHSAVGNLTMLIMAEVGRHPEVRKRIQKEADEATGGQRNVNLFDKPLMPYTEATILEVLRKCSSPIVPHAASQDATIAGAFRFVFYTFGILLQL